MFTFELHIQAECQSGQTPATQDLRRTVRSLIVHRDTGGGVPGCGEGASVDMSQSRGFLLIRTGP